MTLADTRNWLEKVCGPVNGVPPDYTPDHDAYALKSDFYDDDFKTTMDAAKAELKLALSGITLTTGKQKRRLRKDKDITKPVMVETKQGEALDFGVEQVEWDSYDTLASGMTHIAKGNGEPLEIGSPEGQAIIKAIYEKIEPIMKLSREMAGKTGPDGERLFSDREIEKELWAPLVREGVIPSNLVPQKFSETVNVFRNGAAVYTQLMEDEDGVEMGAKKGFDKALAIGQDVIKWTKTIATEAMRYDWGDLQLGGNFLDPGSWTANWDFKFGATTIAEGSREQLAQMINTTQNAIKTDTAEGQAQMAALMAGRGEDEESYGPNQKLYAEWEAGGSDPTYDEWLDAKEGSLSLQLEDTSLTDAARADLEAQLASVQGAQNVTPATLIYENFQASGQSDYDSWLDAEYTRLSALSEDDALTDQEAILFENISGAKVTQDFGEYMQKQAAVSCGAAIASTLVTTAQNARDRKRSRRDTIEAMFEGVGDAVLSGWSASIDAETRTMDADSKEEQNRAKFALLASKAGARCVNKLSQAMIPSKRVDDKTRKDLFVSAFAELVDAAGEGVAATGEDGKGGTENRAERATYGLIGKGASVLIEGAWKAYQSGDPGAAGKCVLALIAGGFCTGFAGEIGDKTRADRDVDDIDAGASDMGASFWSEEGWQNPFEEVEGAAGQAAFGMRADMATVTDQRAVLDETRDLIDQITDESYKQQKGLVAKKFNRIREMSKGNQALLDDLCTDKAMAAWILDDGEVPDKQAMEVALTKIRKLLDGVKLDEDLADKEDDDIVDALDPSVDKAKMKADMGTLKAELAKLKDPDDKTADEDLIFRTYKELRDEMLKDPRVKADIEKGVAEDAAWLEDLRAQADLTRLDQFADNPELREKERQKALAAIQQMTIELKKTEAKLNMLDQATKGAVGIVLAAVPGTGLLAKIRDLVADTARAIRRQQHLSRWSAEMEAMRGNYSVYEYAATGEKEVLRAAHAHDAVQAALDVAGVVAEAMRLADQTHAGAAAFTTFEKLGKLLNDQWYKKYSANRIKLGWETFKQARAEPENRILAREAIRINTTLGKCVLAYGACVDKDSQARHAVSACGLTPEVFEDASDVCQGVVAYLRAQIMDKDTETIAAHEGETNWLPCALQPKVTNWTMIKAAARRLDPALGPKYFDTPEIDEALGEIEAAGSAKDPARQHAAASRARDLLGRYRPMTTTNRPHLELTIAAQDLIPEIEKIRAKALADMKAAAKAQGQAQAQAQPDDDDDDATESESESEEKAKADGKSTGADMGGGTESEDEDDEGYEELPDDDGSEESEDRKS